MSSSPSTKQPADQSTFRTGFAALLGRPNAGKSTLLNALIGEKIAIVSPKPQTTRHAVRGILTLEDSQIVFVDTPGLIEPRDALNAALMESVRAALEGIDVALHLIDVTEPPGLAPAELALVQTLSCPRLLVLTKMDLVPSPFDLAAWRGAAELGPHEEILCTSATTGAGLTDLIEAVKRRLPQGRPLFDPDDLTDRDMRFLAAEIIREKVFETMGQELPYATAVVVQDFREPTEPGHKTSIGATIYVERESQVGMVVGRGGQMIREIGAAARRDIEHLLGGGVFLDLRVKVRKNWRKREADLRMFGYRPPGRRAPRRQK